MDYPLRLAGQLRAHLKALRKLRGLTQAELGQRLGLSQVRIADIEANPGVVSIDQLARILSALDAMLVLRDGAAGRAARPAAAEAEKAPAAVPAPAAPRRGQRRTGVDDGKVRDPSASTSKTRSRAKHPTSTRVEPNKGSW